MRHVDPTDYRARIYQWYATRFQDAGEGFDASHAVRAARAYRHYLRGWLPADRNTPIVDLACGQGFLIYFLQQAGYECISGIDLSPDQVRIARQILPTVEEGNVLDYLDKRLASFGLITAFDLIEHLRKPEVMPFLDACRAALRPGGRLILKTVNAASPWASELRYGDFTHEVAFTPSALSRLLAACGFTGEQLREVGPIPFAYSAAATLRHFAWSAIRAGLKAWNLIETGHQGSRVMTRTFLVSAVRQ